MSKKLIIAFSVIFLFGLTIGHFGGKRIDGTFEIEKTVDSLNVVNQVKDKVLHDFIEEKNKNIKQIQSKIKTRNEDFKNDTIIPSDDELLNRIRAINNRSK